MNDKIEKIIIALFLLLLVIVLQQTGALVQQTSLDAPGETVKHYFEAWDSGDYAGMYSYVSDGFKKIEPTAVDLKTFSDFIGTSTVKGVEVLLINVTSNDGTTANVDYIVNYKIANTTAKSESNFVIKFRTDDKTPGWKIIQPYGLKADES